MVSVLNRYICTFVLSFLVFCHASAAVSAPSPSFEHIQLTHALNQYNDLEVESTLELLSNYGIQSRHLDTFVEGVVRFGRADFIPEKIQCEGAANPIEDGGSNKGWFFNDATESERLSILSKAGPTALWSVFHFLNYEKSNTSKVQAQQCQHLTSIYNAFTALGKSDDASA